MRLTTKGRYAVTAMLDIALHRQHGPISVVDIAERQGISAAYLEQLLAKLKKAGLLLSVRGPGGGYRVEQALDGWEKIFAFFGKHLAGCGVGGEIDG